MVGINVGAKVNVSNRQPDSGAEATKWRSLQDNVAAMGAYDVSCNC